MKSLTEFGTRLVTLHTGVEGIRAGLHFTAKDVAGDEPIMDFVGSDNSVDRYDEVIDQNGWQLENFRANPVIPDCHNYSSIACILGKAVNIEVKDGKLLNRVKFCLDNPLGATAYKMAKAGFLPAQSVGFIPLEWTNGTKDEPSRTYTKCELLEVSMVVVPANPKAVNQMQKALDAGAIFKCDIRNIIDVMKQFCSDMEAPEGPSSANASVSTFAQSLQLMRGLSKRVEG